MGTVETQKYHLLVEGKVYPCVNLSADTSVMILESTLTVYRPPSLPSTESFSGKSEVSPNSSSDMIISPTVDEESDSKLWLWGATPDKKPDAIYVNQTRTIAWRTNKGHNPSIFGNTPLSKENCHFRVQVRKLGNFIGIGIAEYGKFALEGSRTLGQQQSGGVNSCYFWQSNGINKIQLHGEGPKLVEPLHPGSIVDVKLDFDQHRIYYWHDDRLQGYITCTKHKLSESALYPAINMSIGTEVEFRNNDKAKLDMDLPEEGAEIEEEVVEIPTEPFPSTLSIFGLVELTTYSEMGLV
jgi:hypothetical protein